MDILRESLERVRVIQARLVAAQSRQKVYADRKVRDLNFAIGVLAYELALPPGWAGLHPVFYVLMLKRYHADGTYIVRWDSMLLDENLTYEEEPIAILDRQVPKMMSKEIASVKVQ
ncbi:uncharacterized protein LOC132054295 [Lycium ferocissimum]|uniref:uncharacterized protein LOC132054295 n=1 Tax=Lycium ferocissimum TaxID=112874 RepID=UPI002814CA10|nr:uncharacterized protein LOC132054295 [Lycium ferocissimum]